MTYNDFIWKWNGKYVDYDHAFGNQCVDLIRQYCKDILGVDGYTAIPSTGYAKNIFTNFRDNQFFKKILNTPTGIPKKGDIIFFKTSYWFPFLYGVAGHTGIVDQADLYNLVIFNQNYPTGRYCEFRKFRYKDCLGWLTPKK